MNSQEIEFESKGWFKVIQKVWLGLIAVVAVSLCISAFTANQGDLLFNLLTFCLVAMLFHMGHMGYLCCKYLNTRLLIQNHTLYHFSGTTKIEYPLNDIKCDEFPIAHVYKITDAQGKVIAYINGLLPNSKKLATKLQQAEE